MSSFPEIFHISHEGELLRISIRSAEHKADSYLFSKSDISPALDDDPTDDIWSGSEKFSIKRTKFHGLIRITIEGSYGSIYKVNRHQIEVFNAQLKGALAELPDMPESKSSNFATPYYSAPSIKAQQVDYSDLLIQIRTIVAEEIKKMSVQLQPVTSAPQKSRPKRKGVSKPKTTFIPSNLGEGLSGQVEASTGKQDGKSALKSAKKLRELKKS